MKKTIAAILIIALIAAAIALPSFAADSLYFTSVNNVLMPLSDETMPVNYNDTIYLPYSVFNSNELNTFSIYSQSAQIVTVFGNGVQLYYNLQTGTTYDAYGNQYRSSALSSNGRIYIPAAFTCEYFGISYSAIYGNKYGTIIRLTVGDNVLDNDTFSKSASALMKSRLDDYNRAKATPSPSVSASPVPSATPTPVNTPQPSSNPQTDRSSVSVYLSFFGLDAELTPHILSALKLRSVSAAFFVTGDDIAANPDLVRKISGSGHTLGIICGEDITADYASAASLLFEAAQTSSFIVSSAAYSTEEDESGLIFYCSPSRAQELSISSCLKKLSAAENRLDLIFTTDTQTVENLPSLLKTVKSDNYSTRRLTEARAAEYSGG